MTRDAVGRLELAIRTTFEDELLADCRLLLEEELPGRGAPISSGAKLHLFVGHLALTSGFPGLALAHARGALEPAPASGALRLLAAVHHRRGRLRDAARAWERLAEAEPAYQALRDLALLYEIATSKDGAPGLAAVLDETLGAAVPDLVRSCRAALAGDVTGAVRAVDRVGLSGHGRSLHAMKVAAIQRAWALERAGDVHGAIASLERLADEPRLAGDDERLLCLSVLYEREGTTERVRRAARAVRYAYAKRRDPSLLRRIARLLGRLGHHALAEAFERRFDELFAREAGAFTPRDLARAGAAAYVPLPPLASLGLDPEETRAQMERHARRARVEHRRRAAVLALALDQPSRAAALLRELVQRGAAGPTDLYRLADAERLAGDPEAARFARQAAIGAVVDAAALAVTVPPMKPLDDDALAALASDPARLAWRSALAEIVREDPTCVAALSGLAAIERAMGSEHHAVARDAHAMSIQGRGHRRDTSVVLAAAALRRGGRAFGVMHEIWALRVGSKRRDAGFDRADVLGAVSDEFRASAVNVFHAVRGFAEIRFPHRLARADRSRFRLKVTKEDEPSSGRSAEVPIAIAFFASLLGLPVPEDLAATGEIVCEARGVITLARVGDVDAKVLGAHERRVSRIILPRDNEPDVERAERLPRSVARGIIHYAETFDNVVALLYPDLV